MKIQPPRRDSGHVLVLAVIVVMLISGFVTMAISNTGSTAKLTDRGRNYAATQAAAGGALEKAFASWRATISANNGAISTNTVAASLMAPTFPGMSYCDGNGNVSSLPISDQVFYIDAVDAYGTPNVLGDAVPAAITTGVSGHPGWVSSRTFSYVAHVRMKQTSARYDYTVGLKRVLQYTEVPLFQAMYFFQDTIEFYRPATMIVGGLVHTNGKSYMSSSSSGTLTFQVM